MSGKRVLGRVVLGVFLVFLFLGIQYLGDNPYFTWYFRSLYLIESARVESRLLASGEMEVHETIRYRMRKPFRGVFREIPPARYEVMEGVKLWTEDLQTQDVELTPLPRGGFSARVWLVPRGSTYRLDPRKKPLGNPPCNLPGERGGGKRSRRCPALPPALGGVGCSGETRGRGL